MATRKHNEFLDADHSDEDASQGYDSEFEDLKKGGRSPKRRKTDSNASDDEVEEIEEHEANEENDRGPQDRESDEPQSTKKTFKSGERPGISKPLKKKNLVATHAEIKKSGVVFLSRIPPFMNPTRLRSLFEKHLSLLESHGAINHIFLSPEDPASYAQRVRNGGNKRRSFTEGWVEFTNKADAKQTCEDLNARIIGGKKGTYYHDDLLNLIYLNGFKWHHLTRQIAAENASRASRMRAEISKTTKENKKFVQNVERAKMLEGMESKNAAKKRKDNKEIDRDGEGIVKKEKEEKGGERPRYFKQTAVATKKGPEDQSEQVKRVLSKIF
ncbi:hypothetical protein B7494_g5742 [Chlorociboria aeruginascens]|nr:hypothetical protein B7494_g5742 [Chlorociboria aeruginascens]